MRFSDKVVLVTGGSQGIGEAVCRRFAAEGAVVAVVASRDRAKAQGVVDAVTAAGGRASAHVCDVASVAQIDALVAEVIAAHGRIDVLVNGAGVFYPTRIGETDEAMYDRMVDINLKGQWNMINAVSPHMVSRKRGNIINMASVAGMVALPSYGMYCATKAGIIMLTKCMAVELSRSGIHVNSISPGNTASPMNEDIRTDPELKPVLDFMEMLTPSGRTYSSVEEMANAALFLASPKTGNPIYGANFTLDEGFAAGLFIAG